MMTSMKHWFEKKWLVGIILWVALMLSFAFADGISSWTCPNCGRFGNNGNYCPNCGSSAPVSIHSSGGSDQVELIPGYKDKARVPIHHVYANSYIVNQSDPDLWIPEHAVDDDETTSWQFSKKYNDLGTVYLELDLAASQTVDEIWIRNGLLGYGTEGYTRNCRPERIRVEFLYDYSRYGYGDEIILDLKDDPSLKSWQKFTLGKHPRVTSVRLWVLSVYTGTKYTNDVCLSEVMLVQNNSSIIQPGVPGNSGSQNKRGNLLMRLSTRSGPGTQYDEPGTFFQNNWQNTSVEVLGKAWDGEIWWVLVDFSTGNVRYRVWTGLKRVNVNIDLVPEIDQMGSGRIDAAETRRGPGGNYAKGPVLSHKQDVSFIASENGYVEVEYYNLDMAMMVRCWVPESKIIYISDYSSDSAIYDMGVPDLHGQRYQSGQMNLIIYWVQVQLKATGIWYQGDEWDETGNLGNHTMQEISSFMQSRGYSNHNGQVNQTVINELAAYLGWRMRPVYIGGFYRHMSMIMNGGHTGSMEYITSNLTDMIPHVTVGARWVQLCLSKLGYYNGTIDGKYGEATENAVKAFQRANGFQERDYVSLGVARAMLEQCYYAGCNLEDLDYLAIRNDESL